MRPLRTETQKDCLKGVMLAPYTEKMAALCQPSRACQSDTVFCLKLVQMSRGAVLFRAWRMPETCVQVIIQHWCVAQMPDIKNVNKCHACQQKSQFLTQRKPVEADQSLLAALVWNP